MTEIDMNENETKRTGLEIAVIGMAGRFPGAKDIRGFWENLKKGVESITFFTDEELLEAGIPAEMISRSNYVKAKGYIDELEYFDSEFFNYPPNEAAVMDPQVRLLHQCVWHALEDAGCDPLSYHGLIGLYAGFTPNLLWKLGVLYQTDSNSQYMEIENLNSFYIPTLISYKLNLKGPAVSVNTACSTSLVAIHMGCRALLTGEADIVLAGGVAITLPSKTGYIYEAGMVMSADGRCRPFDARANGTASGNGAGIVVLKRLVKAIKDRDHIYAVIKGTAINNDGNRKPGYTAPSVEAQAEVIRAARRLAGVEPESITYIETHGTATPLGDPIEIEALKQTLPHSGKKQYCRLGFVKANIGHLDAAAGAAGFIKTVLALNHRIIPPAVNFDSPNPTIDFENSPFYINKNLEEWQADGYPLRAGVSSFGIGGTNAHAVLEEWSENEDPKTAASGNGKEHRLLLLSAKTRTALDNMAQNLAAWFKANPDLSLADAAYTLQVGRQDFDYRQMLVCQDKNTAIEDLSSATSGSFHTHLLEQGDKPVIFMFPGLGDQYVNMGLDLYRNEPLFREAADRCFQLLETQVDEDIKEILYPSSASSVSSVSSVAKINRFDISQLAVFIFEYALAQLLIHWGIKPHAMIGYSFGEYTAACISGVFSLEDALSLIVARGKWVRETVEGSMLSVPIDKDTVAPLLKKDLSVAIDNGDSCVVAGPAQAVAAFEKEMKEKRYLCIPLQSSFALHSPSMNPIVEQFEAEAAQLTLNEPAVPFISNVTGTRITPGDAVNPRYWATHLRETVRFSDGLKELTGAGDAVFVEIGPGVALSTLVYQYIDKKSHHAVVNLVRPPGQQVSDVEYLLKKIGRLWLYGIHPDWKTFYGDETRSRVPLPGYPFDRLVYSIQLPIQDIDLQNREGIIKLKEQAAAVATKISTARSASKTSYAAPRNRAEEILAGMWEELLGISPIGIHDNLLEMGVNSLKGITFVNRFKEQLGEMIHVTAIFDAPTVSELAAYFSKHYPESFARITGIKTGEDAGPTQPADIVTTERIMRYRRFLPPGPAPAVAEPPLNPPAVFVLSPPRTGSTLLRVMLAGHPRLFAPPELNLMYYPTLGTRKAALEGPGAVHLQGVLHAIMQLKACSLEEAEAIMADFEDRDMKVKEFYRQLQQWLGERLLVDKSPGYANHVETLVQIENYFRDPLYIHLTRHPYGMIRSYEEAKMDLLGGRQLTEMLSFTRRELAEVIWINSVYNILEFLKQVPQKRRLHVSFEDLVANPEKTAGAICRFLNLEFHPEMLQPYKEKNTRMTGGVYTEGQMVGDPKFHQHKTIDPAVVDVWKQHYKKDFLGEPTIETAAALGYEPIEAPIRKNKEDTISVAVSENLWMLKQVPEAAGNIFFIHEISGEVGVYLELCRHLDNRFNCWGIQADRLKNFTPQHWPLEELAAGYIGKIKKVQPRGPYHIVTWSAGGNIAFETTLQMEQRGDTLDLLAFIDCRGPMGRLDMKAQDFSIGPEKNYIKKTFPGADIEAMLEKITDFDRLWPHAVELVKSSESHTAKFKDSLKHDPILAMLNFEGIRVEDAVHYINLSRTLINTAAGYIPSAKIRTPIHLFRGRQSKLESPEYWNDYCHTPVTHHQVEGDHYSIFKRPLVEGFARLFNDLLKK
jgi:acyl transferase domain-containing protein/thioesterase domain-containing protein